MSVSDMAPLRFVWLAVLGVVVVGCAEESRQTTLTVRTTLPRELRNAVERSFEAVHTDVDVRFTEGGPAASFHDLQVADGAAPFDVWWGAPATTLQRAGDIGLLEPFRPAWLAQPGVGEPTEEGFWQVTLVTPFVMAFNREQLTLSDAPRDWIDLMHHGWTEEVAILDPTRHDWGAGFVGAILIESLRNTADPLDGYDWLDRLDAQVERYRWEPDDIFRALERGEDLVAVLPRAIVEERRADGNPWLYYRVPESGTPMLALGVAIARGSMARNAAARFVDHLGEIEIATEVKLHTRWEAAHGAVDRARLPEGFELDQNWTAYPLAVDTLTAEIERWVTRWDLEVRGAGK